ncbi:hypothetical protein [Leptolyngbya sp. NIES-2104]|uniref:hypothetical protein n=1 Tax=Leptolyngbya sp. NIES-2104 TaxID=1552121 RepID=UPI0006EC6099|nr:hypothetical protein [Leptolyngbya sp. NIES-2104]GAP97965.1 hypothetical protein NIES2104_45180 [Leptolyngbya sp. NIES-2104]
MNSDAQPPIDATTARTPDAIAALFELLMLHHRDFNSASPNSTDGIVLPMQFPDAIARPQFAIGDRCRWIPNPATDWGMVIGQVFVPIEADQSELQQWAWVYLLLLDSDSPSRSWLIADWVEEADLELYEND